MDDITLTALLSKDKKLHTRMFPFIKKHSVSEYVWEIIEVVDKYYSSYPSAVKVDFTEFKSFMYLVKGKVKPEKASLYNRVVDNVISKVEQLDKDPTLSPAAQDVLTCYIEKDFATRIANVSFKLADDDKSLGGIDEIESLCREFKKEVGKEVTEEDLFVSQDIEEIAKEVFTDGLEWPIEELNVSAGPLRRGDFVIVGARPETGKTTFSAQCATHFAQQLKATDGPIIWVNNEERDSKVMFRIVQSYFGVTNEVLKKDLPKYNAKFKAEIGGRIKVVSDASNMNYVKNLDRLFAEYKPSLIIFDQLDKVVGYSKEARDDLRLGKLYAWARHLAKEYGPVIAMSQVDGSAAGVKYVTMEHLRGSKTDKAGEADLVITIGSENDPTKINERYMHLAKNKLVGGDRTQEGFRHGYFELTIKPEIARYVGRMKK